MSSCLTDILILLITLPHTNPEGSIAYKHTDTQNLIVMSSRPETNFNSPRNQCPSDM